MAFSLILFQTSCVVLTSTHRVEWCIRYTTSVTVIESYVTKVRCSHILTFEVKAVFMPWTHNIPQQKPRNFEAKSSKNSPEMRHWWVFRMVNKDILHWFYVSQNSMMKLLRLNIVLHDIDFLVPSFWRSHTIFWGTAHLTVVNLYQIYLLWVKKQNHLNPTKKCLSEFW